MGNSQPASGPDNVLVEAPNAVRIDSAAFDEVESTLVAKEISIADKEISIADEGGGGNAARSRDAAEANAVVPFTPLERQGRLIDSRPESSVATSAGPSLGRRIGGAALGSGPIGDPNYTKDSPDLLKMPPGSDAIGTALPSDSHGYTGERDELGQRHGDGVQIFPDGRRYSGQFEHNTFHGSAIMVWPDGHRYTGQYENNHKSGDGFFLWPDGRFYDGHWRMGQRHGHGQYISAESYVGNYQEGFRHGDGVLTWPDGKRYAGQFCRGALHGSAVMSWPDGRRYLGQYADNQKQGEGMFYWPDGRLYEGQWRKGVRHGASRFIDNSGEEHIGNWHKDRLVSSDKASSPGVRDPFCEPPATLLSKRHKYQPQLSGVEEQPLEEEGPAVSGRKLTARSSGRLGGVPDNTMRHSSSPEDQHQHAPVSAQDVVVNVMAELAQREAQPEGVITVNGVDHQMLELHELRDLSTEDLRSHANHLHHSFGHVSSAVPHHDHGLLGWVYEVQSRHLRPLIEAAKYGIEAVERGIGHAIRHPHADSGTADEGHARADDDMGRDFKDVDAGLQRTGATWDDQDALNPGAYPEPNEEDAYALQETPAPPQAKVAPHRRRERPTRSKSLEQEVK